MQCPYCRSNNVYKSKSGNTRLVWPLRLFVVRVRCHDCSKRFWRRGVLAGGARVSSSPTERSR